MIITEEQALENALKFISTSFPKGEAGSIERFYGYYSIPILMDENVYGLLNINGYTGATCYQSCHGSFIDRKELR